MERPTIDNTQAMYQAGSTVGVYFLAAVEMIDMQFGSDYAKEHPELVAALVKAQTDDFNCCAISAAIWNLN